MTEIALYQLDAFASARFAGNPAAVCPLQDDWLPAPVMQAIAAENNLSETAFLLPRPEGYAIRWFTPAIEVDLCGHATLASAYVVSRHLAPGCREVRFDSASGPLTVSCDGDLFTLDFPSLPAAPFDDGGAVRAALGIEPREVLLAPKMMAVLASEEEVRAAVPDLDLIAALPARGLIVTAPASARAGRTCDFVSRYFAPQGGIPEDPVTGSAHCTLAPYWAKRLGKTRLSAHQASARGGDLLVEDRGERVFISGTVVPYLEGRLYVP